MIDPDSIEVEQPQEVRRLLSLWAAVLEGAIRDAASGKGIDQARARAWIMDQKSSFPWLCSLLEINADVARESIQRRGWEEVSRGLMAKRKGDV